MKSLLRSVKYAKHVKTFAINFSPPYFSRMSKEFDLLIRAEQWARVPIAKLFLSFRIHHVGSVFKVTKHRTHGYLYGFISIICKSRVIL